MLNINQIIELCKHPVNKSDIDVGRDLQFKHKQHVTGENYESIIKEVVGYESKEQAKLKKRLARPSTEEIADTIIQELTRWTTTQGTNKNYQFKQKDQEDKFKEALGTVWKNRSIDHLMKTFFAKAHFTDFNGFFLITKPQIDRETREYIKEGRRYKWDGSNLNPYVIFISADHVVDYDKTDSEVHYLLVKTHEEEIEERGVKEKYAYYRYIDKDIDKTFRVKGKGWDKAEELDEIRNELGYVPAVQISSFRKYPDNDIIMTSPMGHVLNSLERYLSKDAELEKLLVLHVYPKLAIVGVKCPTCDGLKTEVVDSEEIKCRTCGGMGVVPPVDSDGFISIPHALDEGKTPFPGSPASYITPEIQTVEHLTKDLKELKKSILYSGTGNKSLIAETIETATEVQGNYKQLEDRVGKIIDNVEEVERFITDTIAKMDSRFAGGYNGCTIKYGRRLNMRDSDLILEELRRSKEVGMPESHIENLQKELIRSRYRNSPEELKRNLILADIEPMCGYTIKEALDMREFIDPSILRLKLNFNERIDQYESEGNDLVSVFDDKNRNKKIVEIREKLLSYDQNKEDQQENGGGADNALSDPNVESNGQRQFNRG